MRNTLTIPNPALKFILLQRTQLQRLNLRLFRKLGISYFPRLCGLETRLRRASITSAFLASIQEDFADIQPHLPGRVNCILDIGCGVGGIDVLLNDHYQAQSPQFFLLDKSQLDPTVFYDFHSQTAFYNSLDMARELLKANGFVEPAIHCLEATPDNRIQIEGGIDLALSLISWGFHYPVSTYVNEVARVLVPGGCVILDVRKGTTGLKELRDCFPEVKLLVEKPKYLRLLARK
jgi:SAM-dependent methyltransferase